VAQKLNTNKEDKKGGENYERGWKRGKQKDIKKREGN
jgi:hypothetical protein